MAVSEPSLSSGGRTANAARLPARLANYLRLGLQRGVDDPLAAGRSAAWVEISETGIRLRDGDAAAAGDNLNIVITGTGGLDMTFELPNGPLPELRQMIEREVRFRSPFAEGAHASFWSAWEQPDGSWRIHATILLRAALDEARTLATAEGGGIGLFCRDGPGPFYAARPTEDAPAPPSGPVRTFLRALPGPLRGAALGAVVLLASAVFLSVDTRLDHARLQDAATTARGEISAAAAIAAERQALEAVRGRSNDRLALVGVLSELLPDGVWLDQLSVEGDEFTLVGFGPSTTEVQRLLSRLPYLTDVRLAAPMTRDNAQSLERFRIAGTLSGPVRPLSALSDGEGG
ncbi:MAG: PilN domain-containing protein [Pseudomonadota bacterium]